MFKGNKYKVMLFVLNCGGVSYEEYFVEYLGELLED